MTITLKLNKSHHLLWFVGLVWMAYNHFKRDVEKSLNYYHLPKLYVKLWLCPSQISSTCIVFLKVVFYIYHHGRVLLPWICAWPPWKWQTHFHKSHLVFFCLCVFLLPFMLTTRIVTATFKATKSWFRSEILWSSSNSSHGLKKLSQFNGVEVLLPHSLWFLKSH